SACRHAMDVVLQSRTPKHGTGRHHPKTAAGHGRIAFLLLAIAKNGGITQGRTLRVLAVLNPDGSRYIKDAPPIQKTLRDFPVMQSWIGLAAPRGTDTEKVQWVGREIHKIASD